MEDWQRAAVARGVLRLFRPSGWYLSGPAAGTPIRGAVCGQQTAAETPAEKKPPSGKSPAGRINNKDREEVPYGWILLRQVHQRTGGTGQSGGLGGVGCCGAERNSSAPAGRSGWRATTALPSEAMSGMTMLPKKVASPSALPESISAFRFRRRWLSCWGKTARRRSPKQNRNRHQNPQNLSHSHPPPEISGGCLATCWGRGRSTARCSQPLYGRG